MKNFEKNQPSFKCTTAIYTLVIALAITVLSSCTGNNGMAVINKTQIVKPAEKHIMVIPFVQETQDTTIKGTVDVRAEYPGGEAAFNQYMDKHVQFHGARQGRTFAEFVIEKDGSLSDIKIVKSVGKDIDDQVIPSLRTCVKWKPASFNGQPVRTRYIMPINGTFKG